jgi:hypothetical protein
VTHSRSHQHAWRFRGIMTAIFVSTIVWFMIAELAIRYLM